MNKLTESLEQMKFACKSCHLPHNLSSREIERITEAVKFYNGLVMGEKTYGFEPKMWDDFGKKYFYREGVMDGEAYSGRLNMLLSGAAVSQVLDEVRKRQEAYL